MQKLNLALKITNWCNMQCAHCSERSGPCVAPNLMPIANVDKYISEFCDLNIPKWEHMVFTGGESMAPYYQNAVQYIPQCMDLTYHAGFVPFFKTNGVWGGNIKLTNTILQDLAAGAYKHGRLASLDISIDEFHNNIAQVANIITTVINNSYLAPAIRISLVGLNTKKSKDNFINLVAQLSARGLKFEIADDMTMVLYAPNTVAMCVYFDFKTPVSVAGRAQDNNIGAVTPNGQTDAVTGDCLQIDNNDVAILNYKWREPVAGHPINTVVNKLFNQMKNNGK